MKPITIVLVEDQPANRAAITAVFRATPDFRLLGEFATVEEALERVPALQPDVAVVDLVFKDSPHPDTVARDGQAGLNCLWRLKQRLPALQCLVLTQYENPELIFQAFCAGASGYCLKRTPPEELRAAIRMIHAGQAVIPPAIARYVVGFFRQYQAPEPLTPTEERVLALLKTGLSTKAIAAELGSAVSTVQTHIKRILAKLHAGSREELLMRYGLGRGTVEASNQ